ncbi:MAG: dpo [Rhizobacter sp.]|nr:dpo [Rhizobacter sp.]
MRGKKADMSSGGETADLFGGETGNLFGGDAMDEAAAEAPTTPAEATAVVLHDWADLKAAAAGCRECPLWEHATQTVFGEGPTKARLMLVGEQPGDKEDLRGRPFVGPSGALLDQAMQDLGWPRDEVYVTNAVKHFKFELKGTRRIHKSPAQKEALACLHWLESEIDLVRPTAIVALGATAARSLMHRAVPVLANRGTWLRRDDGMKVLVTLHPSALLRGEPSEREAAYAQWLDDLRHVSEPVFG